MTVSQAVFCLIAAAGSAYFALRRRRVDFYTIGFAAALLYFLPGFFGFVRSSTDFYVMTPLLVETYLVFIGVLAAIIVGAIVFDMTVEVRPAETGLRIPMYLTTESALVIAAMAFAITFMTSGDLLFNASKSDVMDSIGRWHILFRFAAILAVAFAAARRQVALGAIAVAFLCVDLFIGFRSGFAIAVLSAAVIVLSRQGPQALLVAQRKIILLGLFVIVFLLVYKQIYAPIKLGVWSLVADRLFSREIVTLALINSEPFTTQTVLNEVLRTEFITGPEHLSSLSSLLVPFAPAIGPSTVSYNDLYQQELFGGVVSGGLANNIWAQIYSIGGGAALIAAIPIYSLLLGLGSWLLHRSRGSSVVLVAVVFSFVAFYIHRNDIGYFLQLLRRALMVWAILIVPAMLIVDARRIHRRQPA